MAKDISVTFGGDFDELKNRLDDTKGFVKQWGASVSAIGVGAFAAWGATKVFDGIRAGLSSLFGEMKNWIASATESDQVAKQLEATIISTGGAAGYTAKQLQQMASDLQDLTIFEDDAINSAQTLLLRFKNIKGDEFARATELMLDMAAKTGNMEGAAEKLGRALNDPEKAIRLLRKEGSNLSEEQKKLIQQFVAMGDTASAQRIIISELEKAYGGAAEAATKAAGGGWKQFANVIDDIRKELGDKLLPLLDSLAPVAIFVAKEVGGALSGLVDQFDELGAGIEKAFDIESLGEGLIGTLAVIKHAVHRTLLEIEQLSLLDVEDISREQAAKLVQRKFIGGPKLTRDEELQLSKFSSKEQEQKLGPIGDAFEKGVSAFRKHQKEREDSEAKMLADKKAEREAADAASAAAAQSRLMEAQTFMQEMTVRTFGALGFGFGGGRITADETVRKAKEPKTAKEPREEAAAAASFEGAEDMFRRIQAAAATPGERTMKEQLDTQKKMEVHLQKVALSLSGGQFAIAGAVLAE
jgi:hypothetical protein